MGHRRWSRILNVFALIFLPSGGAGLMDVAEPIAGYAAMLYRRGQRWLLKTAKT